jgi:hypothetical protein
MNGGNVNPKLKEIPQLETVFREHWNHARHCENERLQFTSIYLVVATAILYFTGTILDNGNPEYFTALLLASFALIFSVIGFYVLAALTLGYEHHISDIVMIFYYWDIMEFYRHPQKPTYFERAHRWFFEFLISLFIVLILYISLKHLNSHDPPCWILFALPLPIVLLIEKAYQKTWGKDYMECVRFSRALRNDFMRSYGKKWEDWFRDPNYPDSMAKVLENQRKSRKRSRRSRI